MQLVTADEYLTFLANEASVRIAGHEIELRGHRTNVQKTTIPAHSWEESTVWSFPTRGAWATHKGNYPGNWSPYVPRALIERLTSKGDLVLDSMMGSGTTMVECKLLGRRGVGVDINRDAVILAHDRLNFDLGTPLGEIRLFWGDARRLDQISANSVDMVATHPPYANIICYGESRVDGDLSELTSIPEYLVGMRRVARECFRVLKEASYCTILIGDTRSHAHHVPISFMVMTQFLAAGFVLKEDIIKIQHNTASERGKWKGPVNGFCKIAHEHLFVFRKPRGPPEREALALSGGHIIKLCERPNPDKR